MPNENETQTSQTGSTIIETNDAPPSPGAVPDPAPSRPDGSPQGSLIGGEVAAGEGAGGDEGPSPAPEPITADQLEIPEGLQFEGEVADEFLELMNNPPESRAEMANAMLSAHMKILQQTAGTYAQQWQDTQEEWRSAVRELPEIGGANLDRTMGQIAQVVDRYGDTELREALAVTGAGNHPAMVRFIAKIAKDLNEAPPVQGKPAHGTPKDRASRMFGSAKE